MIKAGNIWQFVFTYMVTSVTVLYLPAQSSRVLDGRSAKDYMPSVEDKSFLQQQRIHIMKKELNDYSERLHLLRNRFETLFYGQSKSGEFSTPFDASTPPQKRQKPKVQYEPSLPLPPPPPVSRIRPSQLAFEIDNPQDATESPTLDDLRNGDSRDEFSTSSEFTYEDANTSSSQLDMPIIIQPTLRGYFVLRPGLTLPFKAKETTYSGQTGKSKRREYKNGFSLLGSGGFVLSNGLYFGGGAFYRENNHDTGKSYQKWPGTTNYYPNGSKSLSAGGFGEIGYNLPVSNRWSVLGNLGLGYGVSVTDKTIGRDVDGFVFAMAGLGMEWTPADFFALSLGYRYLHEEEVPAHSFEVGLKGTF
jgi:hypothetical protein